MENIIIFGIGLALGINIGVITMGICLLLTKKIWVEELKQSLKELREK